MNAETQFLDVALRSWKINVDRASKVFGKLSEAELQTEVAPGKNRPMYLWGHLTAVHDAMLAQLRLDERLHPELDAVFVLAADLSVPMSVSRELLGALWDEVNEALWLGFSGLSPSQWLERHSSVSEEDFVREPHRNRYAMLLGRTSHLSYHLGQLMLLSRK